MAMTVIIENATGAGPSWATVSGTVKWNREDDVDDTDQPIPTPTSTGTNFSYVKTFSINITATGSLTMTDLKFGKVAGETTTGTKLWYTSEHSSYTQASAAPSATGDNNVTAPNINSDENRLITGENPRKLKAKNGPDPQAGPAGNRRARSPRGLEPVCSAAEHMNGPWLGMVCTRGPKPPTEEVGSACSRPGLRWSVAQRRQPADGNDHD